LRRKVQFSCAISSHVLNSPGGEMASRGPAPQYNCTWSHAGKQRPVGAGKCRGPSYASLIGQRSWPF